ncbi:O-methyltransferase [Flectobacillus roseus]|uniref:O-methyltransferase n=1 Tax=Flectobacillus roseus TaxID=502259 RepID=UPI0024B65FE6|nr:class I SAM-dependent methyltransferase [Flectobacillus roseus]MDI9870528.1 class I SAM-dependent methyltransferase [Flectobacillus roseus]
MILSYLKYLLKAGDEHSVHSPFVFDLYYRAIKSRDGRYLQLVRVEPPDANAPKRIQNNPEHIQSIESLRQTLKSDPRTIEITELGAGSKIHAGNQRKISDLSNTAQKPPKYAQLLARLVVYFQPTTILDLGTSLGLTTAYMALSGQNAKVYSFEGCPQTAAIAQENLDNLQIKNVSIIEGNIDNSLPEAVSKLGSLDFIFVDANHRKAPTLSYFEICLPKVHENSIMIFDDIYWSKEMTEAWEQIKQHPSVGISIDLFQFGIVLFRKTQAKQHFVLK